MSEKEPGQTAYEAWGGATSWRQLDGQNAIRWARVERAVLEKAARIAEDYSNAGPDDICEVNAGEWQYGIAAAIRAAGGIDE